jgi:hypothetical protein
MGLRMMKKCLSSPDFLQLKQCRLAGQAIQRFDFILNSLRSFFTGKYLFGLYNQVVKLNIFRSGTDYLHPDVSIAWLKEMDGVFTFSFSLKYKWLL